MNRLKRLKIAGEGNNRIAYFSDAVRTSLADSTVYEGGRWLRTGSTLCFPVKWRNDNSLAAYSIKDTVIADTLPDTWGDKGATLFAITKTGLTKKQIVDYSDRKLKPVAGEPLLIVPGRKGL